VFGFQEGISLKYVKFMLEHSEHSFLFILFKVF
jgi:hypothetical protein